MAIGRCRECHHEPLSDSASCCPNCGSTQAPEFYKGTKMEAYETKCGGCGGRGRTNSHKPGRFGFHESGDIGYACPHCKGTGKHRGKQEVEIWE